MPNLTWDEVRQMANMGFDIGSHTVTHPNLGVVDLERAKEEIVQSKRILEEEIGKPVRWFAYPFGGPHHLRPEYLPLIKEAGYEGTVSGYGGFVRPGMDDRMLPREAVPYFQSTLHLELHLAGILHWLYALKGRPSQENTRAPWPYPEHIDSEAYATVSKP
jgi:peptidoglycan/xylan/chitin deacetylase (PgdA/CDA1 family)